MFEFDRVEDLLVLTETRGWAEAGPVGRYWAACAHYVTHEFAAARRELAHLRGTGKQWDADKLEARLCFEEGRFIEAVENRAPRAALRTSFDEVMTCPRPLRRTPTGATVNGCVASLANAPGPTFASSRAGRLDVRLSSPRTALAMRLQWRPRTPNCWGNSMQ
jgi:hypothetical protein